MQDSAEKPQQPKGEKLEWVEPFHEFAKAMGMAFTHYQEVVNLMAEKMDNPFRFKMLELPQQPDNTPDVKTMKQRLAMVVGAEFAEMKKGNFYFNAIENFVESEIASAKAEAKKELKEELLGKIPEKADCTYGKKCDHCWGCGYNEARKEITDLILNFGEVVIKEINP